MIADHTAEEITILKYVIINELSFLRKSDYCR